MKVLIHAPTAGALERARSDARELLAARVQGTIRLLVSGDGVQAALDAPDADIDRLMILCADALLRAGLRPPPGMETTPNAAVLITRLHRKGWSYMRA